MTLLFVDIGNSQARFARVLVDALEQHSPTSRSEPTRENVLSWIDRLDVATAIGIAGKAGYAALPTGALNDERLDAICYDLKAAHASWIVASVQKSATQQLLQWHHRRALAGPLRCLTRADFPFEVRVREPDRVGIDRLSAAYAASLLKPPESSAIVVDVGTAVTIDAVSRDGAFLGGAILPGIELASRALALGTSQLPPLPRPMVPMSESVMGVDTEQAITNGVFWGCVGAISGIVERMRTEFDSDSVVFLTGGGAEFLGPYVSFAFESQPSLVMVGMALAATW